MSRDWEQCYRDGETPWEKGASAPPLDELLERMGAELWNGGPVLVPGCGLGHDVRRIGEENIPAVGLDLAPSAVERAGKLTTAGHLQFEAGDFLDPEWADGRTFAAMWEHTCFCAIDPGLRDRYAESAAAVLPPGAIFAGVFYLNPNDSGDEDEGPPFMSTVEELETRFGPWFELVDGWVPTRAYPSREGREWIGIFRRLG
ncbi:MAG: thiopurine S-methyltransferase [Akkermansiaceae bacterium]|nr:thiopurine S-methyltransferase [Akkermansiaceae bacterium]